jgi:porphobilinogen synthase
MIRPVKRPRRLRENPLVRRLASEHALSKHKLIFPIFLKEGLDRRAEISSMPGQFQWPEKEAGALARRVQDAGVSSVLLFGIPSRKSATGSRSASASAVIPRAVRAIKKAAPQLLVITDVCLCEYTSHGHCGHIVKGKIANDPTLKTLARQALAHAESGADIVAPSDMMDGRVRAIRTLLDQKGFTHTPILSYAVKYASSFYAPFRDAAENAPSFGDRRSYQMNGANRVEAIREAALDVEEGADLLLVKPALSYGDIVRTLKDRFSLPVGAYAVSGEYAMIKAAAAKKWIDEKNAVMETHLSMTRAGADFLVTYWALDLARWIGK